MTRNRSLAPVIPFIQLYDEGGGQLFTIAEESHTWNAISFKTSHFAYVADSDKIYMNKCSAGYYEIIFQCGWASGIIATIYSTLYKNGVAVTGSRVSTCTYGGGQSPNVCNGQTLHFIIYLEIGDYIEIRSNTHVAAPGVATVAETSKLIIKFIPMEGWNNNRAGREDYKGGVLR